MTEKSKLGLDFNQVAVAKQLAKQIADQVQEFVDGYTTVTVERTLCRLIGIDGIDENEVPMPNRVVDALLEAGVLSQGVLYFMGNAILETGANPQEIAERIYERHTVLSDLLTAMGVPADIAAEDACRVEHVISVESFNAIKEYAAKLGVPVDS